VLACCSTRALQIDNPVLVLGDLKTESLAEILLRSSKNYLLAAVSAVGPKGLLSMLSQKPSAKGKSRCGTCVELLNCPDLVSGLQQRIYSDKQLRKELVGRHMVYQSCYQPELLPQILTQSPSQRRV